MGAPLSARCAGCGHDFVQRTGPGRPRLYCGERCRRQAQRQRDRAKRAAGDREQVTAAALIEEMYRLTSRLSAELSGPLAELLDTTSRLKRLSECLVGSTVGERLESGLGWAELAAAAGVSERSARARWNPQRVRRLAQDAAPSVLSQTTELPAFAWTGSGTGMLVGALRQLPGTASSAQVTAAAVRAGLSIEEADRALAGKGILPWDRMRSLVEQLGGRSEDLHFLWQASLQASSPPPASVEEAAGRLAAALRGMRLAAGQPPLDQVAGLTGMSADRLDAILRGRYVPAWDTVIALATALQTNPNLLRNLWDGVRCTFSASPHHFPRGGFLLG